MMLKVVHNKVVTRVLALFLAILLVSAPIIVPAAHAGGCSTQSTGICAV